MDRDTYRRRELQDVLDAGPHEDETWFMLQVGGKHKSKHLNISEAELAGIRDLLDGDGLEAPGIDPYDQYTHFYPETGDGQPIAKQTTSRDNATEVARRERARLIGVYADGTTELIHDFGVTISSDDFRAWRSRQNPTT